MTRCTFLCTGTSVMCALRRVEALQPPTRSGDILASMSASSSSMVPLTVPTAEAAPSSDLAEATERLRPGRAEHRRPRAARAPAPRGEWSPIRRWCRALFQGERADVDIETAVGGVAVEPIVREIGIERVVVLVEEIHRGHVDAAAHHQQPLPQASAGPPRS